jgi:hypothetical protein
MRLFTWLLPHVDLQNQEDDTVLFSAQAETKEEAVEQIITYLVSLDIDGWSLQYKRYVADWLAVSEPVIRDSAAVVCVSNGHVNSLKNTRRRIRAARAMENLGSNLFSGSRRAMSTIGVS